MAEFSSVSSDISSLQQVDKQKVFEDFCGTLAVLLKKKYCTDAVIEAGEKAYSVSNPIYTEVYKAEDGYHVRITEAFARENGGGWLYPVVLDMPLTSDLAREYKKSTIENRFFKERNKDDKWLLEKVKDRFGIHV